MTLRAVLSLLALALTACGSDDDPKLGPPPRHRVPGCEQFDVAPCNIETSACQTRLMGLAACLRGSEDAELPPIAIISEAEFASYLEEQYQSDGPTEHLAEWQQAFSMLNLVAPGGLEAETQVAESVQNIWGYYSYEDKTVSIIDHGSDSSPETASAVLLHEFVHALQDREVDLTAYWQQDRTYDAGLAADAVVEGEARFQETRFSASMLGFDPARIDWDRVFQSGVENDEQWLFKQDSVLTAAWDAFPYEWGARRIHLDWDATGHAGVLALFASPPGDSQVLMASVDAVATDVQPVAIDAPAPPPEWEAIGEDVLGAFGAFELFGKRTELAEARELGLAWRGDKLAVYAGASGEHLNQTALVWQCEFADEGSATSASQLFLTSSSFAVSRDGTRLTLAAASDGATLTWALNGPLE